MFFHNGTTDVCRSMIQVMMDVHDDKSNWIIVETLNITLLSGWWCSSHIRTMFGVLFPFLVRITSINVYFSTRHHDYDDDPFLLRPRSFGRHEIRSSV